MIQERSTSPVLNWEYPKYFYPPFWRVILYDMRMEVTLIKLGGSLITDKSTPYKARKRVISRLVQEIKKAIKHNPELHLIVGNGSGSFAHTSAAKYQTASGYKDEESKFGFCFVQNDAIKINRICVEAFLKAHVMAIGVSPNNIFLTANTKIKNSYLSVIEQLLKEGITPLLYGDTIADTKQGCCIYSCDKVMSVLSNNLSSGFKVARVISVGDYDGVLDENKQLVRFIDKKIYQHLITAGAVKGSDKTDVTGGMKAKLDEMVNLSESGIESIILNGSTPNNLFRCLVGKKYQGTLIKI